MCFKQEDNQPGCSQQGSSFNVRLSLDFVASRPAKVGDKLVTTKFKNSLTGGFAAVEEPTVAVCLLPGTEVAFETEVECEHVFKVFRSQKPIGQKVARIRQIQPGAAQRASRRVGVSRRSGREAHPIVRRSARDRAAVAGFSARHEGSGAAEARFSRYLIGPLAIELA